MTKGTYKHSEETKQRMRDAHKGKVISNAQRHKISTSRIVRKAQLGYLNSPDARRKLSEGRSGVKNWNYGKPRSEETRRKIADAQRGRTGYRHTPETRARMGQSRTGARNPAWKGGITTPERRRFYGRRRKIQKRANGGSHTYDQWENLKAQYNWTCPPCERSEPDIKLTEDHIIPISKGGSDNIENIQPLCQSCNSIKYTKMTRYPLPSGGKLI